MKAEIIELKETDSTNEFCKRLKVENAIVVAGRQTQGKGTKGRGFHSGEGGLYLTKVTRHENFDFSKTFTIMINSCVAVCKTLERFGLKPTIKWANDVFVGGKKICGTLIENRLEGGGVCHSMVGIGLNVNNELSKEIKDIATTMREQTGKRYSLKRVRCYLIKYLDGQYTVDNYKSYVDWFGKEVYLECGGEQLKAVALDVDQTGCLVCNVGGQIKKISNAEMSLRLQCKSI